MKWSQTRPPAPSKAAMQQKTSFSAKKPMKPAKLDIPQGEAVPMAEMMKSMKGKGKKGQFK